MSNALNCARHAAAAIAAAAVICGVAVAAPSEIRWDTRVDRAAALSRETGKPILIEFWATWCEACAAMDKKVYADPAVANAMTAVLPVRVDIDRDPATARRYNVAATPTLVLVDAAGDELFRFTGSLEREPLLGLLRELPADIRRINTLAAAVAVNKADVGALDALAGELRGAALYVASNRYYERALQTEKAKRDAALRAHLLTSIGRNYVALKRPADAAEWFRRAEKVSLNAKE